MRATRLFDILLNQLEHKPLDIAVSDRGQIEWKSISTRRLVDSVNSLSAGLLKFGIQKKDKVAIASYNCSSWVIADFAITQIGGINVPLYPNSAIEDYSYIIGHSEAKIVFCGDQEIFRKITAAVADMEYPPLILSFAEEDAHETYSWETLFEEFEEYESIINKRRSSIDGEELASIIYTSGTTGNPKGVMLSHRNIISNCESLDATYPVFQWKERCVSFLPLCHIFERTAMYHYMRHGVSIYFVNDLDRIGDLIREVRPHYFNAVPRVLEKVYDKLVAAGNALSGIKKKLFFWALDLARQYTPFQDFTFTERIKYRIADKLIYSKWRAALGGNIVHIISGAAALQPDLVRIFWAAGIHVLEAYGLTETSPGVAISVPEKGGLIPGCVGRPISGVKVSFDYDGELLVQGENVMLGYYKNPEETEKVMNGIWFRTGDIGEFTAEGFIRITDRKKEIFKTSGGKYIAPQKIENIMKASPMIEQIMVVGEGKKFPSALIVLPEGGFTDMNDHELEQMIMDEVDKFNANLAQFEKIKKIKVLREQWDIESGLLTPTMKMKRKHIHSRYEDLIESMYSE